jgi:lysozyme
MRRTLIGVTLIVLITIAVVWSIATRWHPSDELYPRQGIDVSHHQGSIDWARLPRQGVDFAYIKASEGGDHRDSAFAANWAGAGRVGILHGAYHFFTFCRSGADQAANFIATVPIDPTALPPAVDLEYLGNCAARVSVDRFHRELATFIRLVEARYGKRVTLYTTQEFDTAYAVSARVDRPLWLRSLVVEPHFGARHWAIWQTSNFRMLDGIDGRVDWNAMR